MSWGQDFQGNESSVSNLIISSLAFAFGVRYVKSKKGEVLNLDPGLRTKYCTIAVT